MEEKYIIAKDGLPLKGKFFFKILKKLIYFYLYFYDLITSFKKKNSKLTSPIKNPKKILISNIAYLGDVVITTSIIPIIKKHFPHAKLFFLGNSSTESLIKNHNLIEAYFCFDHMRHNRKKINYLKKIIKHFQTKKLTIKQIKKENIDLAIDFFFVNPNSIKLLYKAKIPNILGYTNGGYKNLLTFKLDKQFNPFLHMSEHHLQLLNVLLEKKEKIRPLEPNLPYVKKPKYKQLKNYENENFVLIHPGASEKKRYINLNQAQKILEIVSQDNLVLFVGSGKEEEQHIENIIKGNTKCINLSNKLHVLDLIYLCDKAKMVISTDSSISHIASCFDNPQIVLFRNHNIIHQNLWCLNKPNIQICQIQL
ncbi:MAG: glycosyltransferase family 9 protein [Parachlamydiales bacterium]|nr:glycosyltransferase family 9 protein [Parachlamydiales bacterium]